MKCCHGISMIDEHNANATSAPIWGVMASMRKKKKKKSMCSYPNYCALEQECMSVTQKEREKKKKKTLFRFNTNSQYDFLLKGETSFRNYWRTLQPSQLLWWAIPQLSRFLSLFNNNHRKKEENSEKSLSGKPNWLDTWKGQAGTQLKREIKKSGLFFLFGFLVCQRYGVCVEGDLGGSTSRETRKSVGFSAICLPPSLAPPPPSMSPPPYLPIVFYQIIFCWIFKRDEKRYFHQMKIIIAIYLNFKLNYNTLP